MKTQRFLLALVVFGTPIAVAHSSELKLRVQNAQQTMVIQVSLPDGRPLTGVKLEYRVNHSPTVALTEAEAGRYVAPAPVASPHGIALEIVDVTFPEETTAVRTETRWPPDGALDLTMPPGTPNYLRPSVLLPILIAPMASVLLVLAWLLLRRERPEN